MRDAQKSMQNSLIKVITGPKLSGKSVFAVQIMTGQEPEFVVCCIKDILV